MSTSTDPQPAHAGEPPRGGHDDRPTSVAAIIGLVGAFVFWPVGLVASIIGIRHTRHGRKKGRGLAVAGAAVSVLAAVVVTSLVIAIASAVSDSSSTSLAGGDDLMRPPPAASPKTPEAAPSVSESVPPAAEAQEDAPAGATVSQAQALRTAKQYLAFQAFSYQGLIDQLSSEYGNQFSVEDATYAADNVGADWNEQAARAAEQYLQAQGFSRDGMIQQLSSEYGSKFTREQAEYGATQAGL